MKSQTDVPRLRGRPTNLSRGLPPPISASESARLSRAARGVRKMDISGVTVARIRALREARSQTTEQILTAALDALATF